MNWCQKYAWQNRKSMLDLLASAVEDVAKRSPDLERTINIHHNFCRCERCRYTVTLPGHGNRTQLSHLFAFSINPSFSAGEDIHVLQGRMSLVTSLPSADLGIGSQQYVLSLQVLIKA